jgi:hypothetical protein
MTETDTTTTNDRNEKMIEYIKVLKSIEDAMEPFQESRKELRKDFISQGWLTKEEISNITKAYRMLKKKENIDELVSAYDALMQGRTQNDA